MKSYDGTFATLQTAKREYQQARILAEDAGRYYSQNVDGKDQEQIDFMWGVVAELDRLKDIAYQQREVAYNNLLKG